MFVDDQSPIKEALKILASPQTSWCLSFFEEQKNHKLALRYEIDNNLLRGKPTRTYRWFEIASGQSKEKYKTSVSIPLLIR